MEAATDKLEKWVSMYNRIIREWLNHELSEFNDLNESNYYYVLIVCEHPGLSQTELIQYIYREQSIVTKAIRYLVDKGWLAMHKDPNDRRRSVIVPSEKGQAAYSKLKEIAQQANLFATQGLEPKEAVQLEVLLKKALNPLPGVDKFQLE